MRSASIIILRRPSDLLRRGLSDRLRRRLSFLLWRKPSGLLLDFLGKFPVFLICKACAFKNLSKSSKKLYPTLSTYIFDIFKNIFESFYYYANHGLDTFILHQTFILCHHDVFFSSVLGGFVFRPQPFDLQISF